MAKKPTISIFRCKNCGKKYVDGICSSCLFQKISQNYLPLYSNHDIEDKKRKQTKHSHSQHKNKIRKNRDKGRYVNRKMLRRYVNRKIPTIKR